MKIIGLSPESARRITDYVDRLCRQMKESEQEIRDFREEMTANLVSGAIEHMQTGMGEEEAVTIALTQFGEAKEVKRELEKVYAMKRRFAAGVLRGAFTLLALSAICLGLIIGLWNERMVAKLADEAYKLVEQEAGNPGTAALSEPLQEKLKDWVDHSWGVKGIQVERPYPPAPSRLFMYAADSKTEQWFNFGSLYMIEKGAERPKPDTNFLVKTTIREVFSYTTTDQTEEINDHFIVSVALTYFNYTFFYSLGLFLLGGYWLLFTVWAGMKAYYEGKGNIGWIALFLLTNVVGYGLYLVSRGPIRLSVNYR
ncbi:permease prefix domain 1-containing protein [Paenibacillus sp. CN-4]|uniref:permease prefix domain 1-containing protein n=1 Tax=Paenibacillus nanchangensis TaxID=3348343 RepID=UPI00397BC326